MTYEMFLQRFIGAYMAFTECDESEAEGVASELTPGEVDVENDCPVATAKEWASEDTADADSEAA
jgi:hypothetical protein